MATRRGPDNSIRLVIGMLEGSTPMANVLWTSVTTSGTPSAADLDAYNTAFSNAFKTNFAPHMANTCGFVQSQAQLFLPGNGLVASLIPMSGAGTGGALGSAVQSTASVVSWQINDYYRGGKPRTYVCCTPGSLIVNNSDLTAAEMSALLSSALAFRTAVNALTSTPIPTSVLGTVSFRRGGVELAPPVFKTYIGAKVHPRVGTQRHRLGRWRP